MSAAMKKPTTPLAAVAVLSPPTQAPVCLYFERNGEDKCHGHFTGEHVPACPLFGVRVVEVRS